VHVRRPRLDYESHAIVLDRNELGALLVVAGLGSPVEHALTSLLALNGLRASEATGANIEHLGLERGHRTLVITRKGGKVVTIPLASRTARAIDLVIGERTEGPLFVSADGRRLDRHSAARIVPAAPGLPSTSARTRCGMRSSLPLSTPTCHRGTCRKPPPTPTHGPPRLRPGTHQPGPARHLYRRRLHSRGSQITHPTRVCLPLLGRQADPKPGSAVAEIARPQTSTAPANRLTCAAESAALALGRVIQNRKLCVYGVVPLGVARGKPEGRVPLCRFGCR
jgi:hypothetical protein